MKRKLLLSSFIIPLLITACSGSSSSAISSSLNSGSEPIISSNDNSSFISGSDVSSSSINKSSSDPARLSSNSSSSSKKEDIPVSGETFSLNFDAILLKDENNNPIKIKYDIPKNYLSFDHNATTFKKELALVAAPFVVYAPEKEDIQKVYQFFEFDDIYMSEDYDLEETVNTIKCIIGHKHVNDYELINISVGGYNYMKPWQNNFTIGKNGNHQGFQEGAIKLLPMIINYLNKYKDYSKVKVFLNGYSRSAAIANLTASLLIDHNLINENNLYTYLYETPRGIDINNTKEYKSIFNIINSADLITYVAPQEYNLKRVGVDIETYKENADELLKAYNDKIDIGRFTVQEKSESDPKAGFDNDVEFVKFVMNYLLEPVGDNKPDTMPSKDISSRENFVDNVQGDIGYVASFALSLPSKVIDAIVDKAKNTPLSDLLMVMQEDGPYNFISPVLDDYKISYDAETLKAKLNGVLYLLQQKSNLLFMAMSEDMRANLLRTIYFHTLETVVPLIAAL